MKILLLTTHLNKGGIGIYTVNLAKYLKKKGVEAGVASSGGELVGILESEGISHHYLNIRTKAEFGLKALKAFPRLAALIKDNGYDIVHAQTRVTQVLAAISGKIAGVPFVSTCHGFFNHRRLSRRLYPCWGKKVVAISNSVKEHLINDLAARPEKVEMIYNGIELERYRSVSAVKDLKLADDMGLDEGAFIVGTIGRLSSVKGYKYLVSAMRELVDSGCRAQLVMVGEGPEEENLKEQIIKLNIEDKVFITPGIVPLEQYMTLFDIFCLPSIHEGLGLSLMEAMAAGRACVASDVGGLAELIKNEEDGILVPVSDTQALCAAMLRLSEDLPLRERLANNARRKAFEEFAIEDNIARMIKLYEGIVNGKL